MLIDNQKKTISLRLWKLLFLIIYGSIIVLLYTTSILDEPYKWITKNIVALVITVVFIGYYLYHYLLNQNYIYFNDTGVKIVIRFYSLRPLSSNKNSIEILKPNLHKFEVVEKFFGLKEILVLYQKTKSGIAKYPPICLSALTNEEKTKLKEALRKYAPDGQ
jgi:hypothetical protein